MRCGWVVLGVVVTLEGSGVPVGGRRACVPLPGVRSMVDRLPRRRSSVEQPGPAMSAVLQTGAPTGMRNGSVPSIAVVAAVVVVARAVVVTRFVVGAGGALDERRRPMSFVVPDRRASSRPDRRPHPRVDRCAHSESRASSLVHRRASCLRTGARPLRTARLSARAPARLLLPDRRAHSLGRAAPSLPDRLRRVHAPMGGPDRRRPVPCDRQASTLPTVAAPQHDGT